MTTTDNGAGRWWDWHLFGLWVLVNAAAFAVVPLVGVIVEQLAATAAKNLAQHHRVLTVLIIAVIGAALQGIVVGRWQWRLLQRRLTGLERRRWVTATVIPAFGVWLLAIAPQAVDLMAQGGNTLTVFRNGFIQALGPGPADRPVPVDRVAGSHQPVGVVVRRERDHIPHWGRDARLGCVAAAPAVSTRQTPAFFPVLAFVVHGTWMLWVTAPQAAHPATPPRPAAHAGRVRRRDGQEHPVR
jgi:hypothetical protein